MSVSRTTSAPDSPAGLAQARGICHRFQDNANSPLHSDDRHLPGALPVHFELARGHAALGHKDQAIAEAKA
jgi:hypothetical protein